MGFAHALVAAISLVMLAAAFGVLIYAFKK